MNNPLQAAMRRRTVEANLFPAALPAVEPWDRFRWHSAAGNVIDAYKEHSSQALAIDVFGTLKVAADRDVVLGALAKYLGLPAAGPWVVSLEWHADRNPVREKQRTWVDAAAWSPQALIYFECKFTELDGGACSQTQPLRSGPRQGLRQCNGAYTRQVNPANGREAWCALSGKGIRYWDLIPEIFNLPNDLPYRPCPFAGPWFQWMRNLTNCYALARETGRRPAFVVAYADGPTLPMAERVRSREWEGFTRQIRPEAITFQALPMQTVIGLAQSTAPGQAPWAELAAWVERKIANVCRARLLDGVR